MPLSKEEIKSHLISSGVKNLNGYGYANASVTTITKDNVYSEFFSSMLVDNLGKASSYVDEAIKELIEEIKSNRGE